MLTASLPMYSFGEVAKANQSLWATVSDRLQSRGFDTTGIRFDTQRRAVPDDIGRDIFFTQVCGYPLMKKFRGQARMLAAPSYSWSGCLGATHRAYFIARADEDAGALRNMHGRIFGCNSRLSNSGMNLPRLTLARLGATAPFFSTVMMTGGHRDSIEQLLGGSIDLCSVDCVTWGLLTRYVPELTSRCRVLDETPCSPSLPFVTSIATREGDATMLADTLHDVMRDPATAKSRDVLGLTGLAVPDLAAYERLEEYEREAIALGYPEIE